MLHSQASAAKPCQNACPLSICTRPSAAAAGGGGGAAAAARKPHRFRHARISASHLALFECLTPGPLWQAWHCCPARDQKVPAFDRAAHPKAALCTAGPRDNADLQFYSRGGRETLAGGGADGTAGGMRALPCAPLRGCQPLCDPREASDDHGQVRGMFYRSTSHPPTIVTIVLGRVVHAIALANVSCHYIFSCPVAGTSSWRDAFGVSQNRCDDLNSSTVHVFAFLEAPHALDCGAV